MCADQRIEAQVDLFLGPESAREVLRAWFVGAVGCLVPPEEAVAVLDGTGGPVLREISLAHWSSRDAGRAVTGDRRLDRFLDGLARPGRSGNVFVDLGRDDEPMIPIDIRLWRSNWIPSWAQLTVTLGRGVLLGGATSRRLLSFMKDFVNRTAVNFGQVASQHLTSTALEVLLSRVPDRTADAPRDPDELRMVLRGYAWLTICSPAVTARLGGVDRLRDTGAFVEVEALVGGGSWLLATQRFDEYDLAAARRVFPAVAAALPRGLPRDMLTKPDPGNYLVVREDAGDYQDSE